MASFIIEGGHKLEGEIRPQGAKNEALQIICATLLTQDEVVVRNMPDILDVNNLIQLLRDMGVRVTKESPDTYRFQAADVDLSYLQSEAFLKTCASLRGSVMLAGPLRWSPASDRPSSPSPEATRLAAADWTRTSSAYRSWEPTSTTTPTAMRMKSRPNTCGALTCCWTRLQ